MVGIENDLPMGLDQLQMAPLVPDDSLPHFYYSRKNVK